MALRLLHHALPALLLPAALSQSTSLPADLTTGFLPSEQVQVSFSATAADGFAPGTVFSRAAVAQEPTFALGDSNGISPSTLYTLIMLDATCPTARKLHYARSNFRFAFAGGTNIETDSPPLLDYLAPGALGERGDERQYVFLMYENPQRSEIADLQLPAEGEVFDVKAFQEENGLDDAVAGVNMVVQLGGAVSCDVEGGADQGPSGGLSSASATTTPEGSATSRPGATSAVGVTSALGVTSVPAPVQTPNPQAPSARPSSAPISSRQPPALTDSTSIPRPTSVLTDVETSPSSVASIANPSLEDATDAAPPPPTGSAIEQQTANAAAGVVVGQGALLLYVLGIARVLTW
ncbi:hypothetical protein G6514_008906 [Epicoccum nigrum]|nr:hypothetical protein G6514_008906 [Epicoccum nigrum]